MPRFTTGLRHRSPHRSYHTHPRRGPANLGKTQYHWAICARGHELGPWPSRGRDAVTPVIKAAARRHYLIPLTWIILGALSALVLFSFGLALFGVGHSTNPTAGRIVALATGAAFLPLVGWTSWRAPLWIVLDGGNLSTRSVVRSDSRKIADIVSVRWRPRQPEEGGSAGGPTFTFAGDTADLSTPPPMRVGELIRHIRTVNPQVILIGFPVA